MNQPVDLRETLLRYRLNELDDAERERIDVLMIADADFSDSFQEAEYDLLDAYAADELSPENRQRVERALEPETRFHLAPPQRKSRLLEMPQPAGRPTVRRGGKGWLAVAALLLVVLFLGGLVWQHTRASKVIAPELAYVTRQADKAKELATASPLPVVRSERTPASGGSVTQTEPRPEVNAIATVLLVGASRSEKVLSIHIAPQTKAVRFTWPIPADSGTGTRYFLQVLNDTGEVRCDSQSAPGAAKSGERVAHFTCPSANLLAGTNFVRIVNRSAPADAAPILEVTLAIEQ